MSDGARLPNVAVSHDSYTSRGREAGGDVPASSFEIADSGGGRAARLSETIAGLMTALNAGRSGEPSRAGLTVSLHSPQDGQTEGVILTPDQARDLLALVEGSLSSSGQYAFLELARATARAVQGHADSGSTEISRLAASELRVALGDVLEDVGRNPDAAAGYMDRLESGLEGQGLALAATAARGREVAEHFRGEASSDGLPAREMLTDALRILKSVPEPATESDGPPTAEAIMLTAARERAREFAGQIAAALDSGDPIDSGDKWGIANTLDDVAGGGLAADQDVLTEFGQGLLSEEG